MRATPKRPRVEMGGPSLRMELAILESVGKTSRSGGFFFCFGDASIDPLEAFPLCFRALCVPGSHLSGDALSGGLVGPEQVHRPVSLRAPSRASVEVGAICMSVVENVAVARRRALSHQPHPFQSGRRQLVVLPVATRATRLLRALLICLSN